MRVIIIADGFVEVIQDYTLVKSLAACLAHKRCSLNPGCCYYGDQRRGMEDMARGRPECPPRGKGWRREAELEAIPGEGSEMPTLGEKAEGTAVVPISCLQLV